MADNWSAWENHVLDELKELKLEVKKSNIVISDFKTELALLKLKSGLWGFVAGAIPVAGSILLWMLKNQLSS